MAEKSRIPVRDRQMPFSLSDSYIRSEFRCVSTGGINNDAGRESGSGRHHLASPKTQDRTVHNHVGAQLFCALDEKHSCARWINHSVFRNKQATCQSFAQVLLTDRKIALVEQFNGNTTT